MSAALLSHEPEEEIVVHSGQCHCGLVKIAFEGARDLVFDECNCSICYALGLIGVDIPSSRLVKFEGREHLQEYTFNKKIAKHWFCSTCGASPLHVPRSKPDGYTIHLRCLDKSTIRSVKIVPFDGQNWETAVLKEKAARLEV
ncbi:hypothetical protein TWF696_009550 [Orbilia brochopaga]|uniref:CENP-V/GFA domain-containing protein n=1 Tax=Orbilia brochopaga TaxID=3140254 RepID=A0AAV9UFD0_9PEZI